MERLHVHYLRELVHRLRLGASQRAIAHDLGLARMTVQKYAQLAAAAGYLDAAQPLPEAAELNARLGPPPQPPRTPSTVEPYRAQVEQLLGHAAPWSTPLDQSCVTRSTCGAIASSSSTMAAIVCCISG